MRRSLPKPLLLVLSLVFAVSAVWIPGPGRVIALEGDKRPNLQMIRLRDWHLDWSGGRRLLRFTTIFVNVGPGPFELRGHRQSTSEATMDIDQAMFRWDGTKRLIDTRAIARYSGDGHDHWHVQDVVTYEAWKLSDAANTRRGAKTGFCFFDTTPWNLSLPRARQRSYYRQEWCGTRSVLSNRVGVSVGWGDRYPWDFTFQWIDITHLPAGRYMVRATVDIQDYYDEKVETDNCVWTALRIPEPGSGLGLRVRDQGRDCGEEAIMPVSTFLGDINWDPPRHVTFAPAVHIGYKLNSQGTTLDRDWRRNADERGGTASARATPPGRTGRWLYVVSGPFAGYWFKDSDDIRVSP
jgi:hypothetical protein